jgi:hypothetical protein
MRARRPSTLIGQCVVVALLTFPGSHAAEAKVSKIEVMKVEKAFAGRSFGAIGTYDKVVARVTIAVDPADSHNQGIVDLALAPHNADGLVEAVSDVEILRPSDPSKANRRLLYEVLNRGRKLGLVLLNDAPGSADLAASAAAGNGFLMERGYTVVWAGWQGDTPAGEGRLTFKAPVVPNISGLAREEFVFDNATDPAPAPLTYPAASLDPAQATLTVREHADDPRKTPPDLAFTFDAPNRISIKRPAGYDAGAIYELVYTAKDPQVMGLGFAVTRDLISFLRHETTDQGNPLAAIHFDHAIGLGISQSGRYIKDFLYQGFNEDEAGRIVFDGIMPHISGSKKTFVNARFAQPGRHSQQHNENTFPGDQFPFTYPVLSDRISGRTDGLLARCLAAKNCPKIIHTDSGLEIYQSRASLVVTDTKGEPIEMPGNVRLYLSANYPHFAPPQAQAAPNGVCQQPLNPLHAGAQMRALLVVMNAWLSDGSAPPASRYPSRRDGTLVRATASQVGFPAVPGFAYNGMINGLTLVDYTQVPPAKRDAYPVFVGKTDADGHDVAGIRMPAIDVPTATYTAWNFRKEGFAAGDLCDLSGSALPFAATKAQRLAAGDARLSLEERYPKPGDYAAAVRKSVKRLVADRLMLEEDARRIIDNATTNLVNEAMH